MNKLSFETANAEHTEAVGAAFAAGAFAPLILWLKGDLGSGKTTFSRGFIRALGYKDRVKSPTYTLLEVYEAGEFNVAHLDLYRLSGARELETLGIRDYLDRHTICLIEWPENAAPGLPAPDVTLSFLFTPEGHSIQAAANTPAGEKLMDAASRAKRAH